ncbi:orf119c (mitochondrion) [Beta vulgaris subsp. vulgaris]|uniref:Orf119a protein n=3 Tax=Beta TaxID=3554 RepID=Q9ME61_BETVV|nr:orf119a [Beta vulgaris subsp. vulgaris]NP_064109.1 orf119c [Beta vulgaris subsp. vulgaris]YP_004222297.1 hypothetical protein LKY74_mgp106 [Beta vulgaris subsp. maritima]YP_004222351.1 hypothetical protein LKY74_mgp047 [Beta vulgaris subsp. maritima]YP_004842102.1 hypothetical protein LKY79_mgp106 [Beta macrocarpa]YP_004842156.1 hypothetical protein LKY79_mgp049 [Beta macrocarpa]CBJ13996.1 hypothetical protein [Beta vulgaris subsp. maritima]CBJ14032.1 hypothetical protein [Beta vulgaris s
MEPSSRKIGIIYLTKIAVLIFRKIHIIKENKTPSEITLMEMQDTTAVDSTSEVKKSRQIKCIANVGRSRFYYSSLITSPLNVSRQNMHDSVEVYGCMKTSILIQVQLSYFINNFFEIDS